MAGPPVETWRDALRDGVKDVVRRNHRWAIFRMLSEASKTYLRAYYNENHYRFEHNGEAFVIDSMLQANKGPVTVFDVGANRGTWALEVLKRRSAADVHCFEIAPGLFGQLTDTLSGHPDARLNSLGLSDKAGELELNYVPSAHSTSSLHETVLPKQWGFKEEKVQVQVTTGDAYCKEHGVSKIDFLKIDTEGHDLSVLCGFKGLLEAGSIGLIQFEHGFVHVPSRSLLRDFYDLLEPLGYRLGRLYPASVGFKDYEAWEDEQFRMGNYVAVHSSQSDLFNLLK
ncbi:MAG: FkbM family methyltransferase [Alphaproteobacteria bacterium]|nr:FkbM family methyltransferase [Alphaproteobacteria bacterium]